MPPPIAASHPSFSNVDDVSWGEEELFSMEVCVRARSSDMPEGETRWIFWGGREKARNRFKTKHLKDATAAATIAAVERIRMKEGN